MSETASSKVAGQRANTVGVGAALRLGAAALDILFYTPVVLINFVLNGLYEYAFVFAVIPNLMINFWYFVYLPKRYGGSPGKLVFGLRIVNLMGTPFGWKAAIVRQVFWLGISFVTSCWTAYCLLQNENILI